MSYGDSIRPYLHTIKKSKLNEENQRLAG
jgi:hypothetical protein